MNTQDIMAEELMELEREAFRRFDAGDVDWLRNLGTETMLLLPPGSGAIVGNKAMGDLFKEIIETEGADMFWEPQEAHVSLSGDMGYVYGKVKWKMPGAEEETGKYISILTKKDGAWKAAVEIRNSNG